jgi:hypothetical protein
MAGFQVSTEVTLYVGEEHGRMTFSGSRFPAELGISPIVRFPIFLNKATTISTVGDEFDLTKHPDLGPIRLQDYALTQK